MSARMCRFDPCSLLQIHTGEVAEWPKALVCYARGARVPPRFESWLLRQIQCPVAQLAERRSYKAEVGGSKPQRATITTAVAQRNRARLCEGRGRRFKSSQPCQPVGDRPAEGHQALTLEAGVRIPVAEPVSAGCWSNGMTAASKPADRRSSRRRPANV